MTRYPELTVGEFCETGSGGTPSRANKAYYGGNIPWVKSGELREDTITQTEETITERALKESSAKLVPKGAILLAMYGATVGRMAFLGVEAATNQAICSIRPDPKHANARYVFHCLQARVNEFVSKAAGGAQPNISQKIIRETKVSLPPLNKQSYIAEILDRADGLRRQRNQGFGLFHGLAKSIFLETANKAKGDKVAIAEFADVLGGKRLPKGHDYSADETDYKYLRVVDIQNERLRRADLKNLRPETFKAISRYVVSQDDVVISIAGTIGATRHINSELDGVNLTENAAKIVLQNRAKVDPVYLNHALGSADAQAQIQAATGQVTIGKLALFRIEELKLSLPPFDEQQRFRSQITELQKAKATYSHLVAATNSFFSSLQHRAFSGQL